MFPKDSLERAGCHLIKMPTIEPGGRYFPAGFSL